MAKKERINISMDKDLADFMRLVAAENRISVSDIYTQFVLSLKRRHEAGEALNLLADPKFAAAAKDVRGGENG